jgi:excisionase family DNA binding protein
MSRLRPADATHAAHRGAGPERSGAEADDTVGTNQLEPLLGVSELARYLGIPVKTLYAWRYRHQGPRALRVGRHLRYRVRDVEEWMLRRLESGDARSSQ